MDFHFIDDEYVWNIPLSSPAVSGAQFLQSWEWGIFQQTFGRAVHRIQIVEGETAMAAMQVFEYPLPFGKKYLYAPRGPVILSNETDLYDTIVQQLCLASREITADKPSLFFRGEPVASGYSLIRANKRIVESDKLEKNSDASKAGEQILYIESVFGSFGFRPGHSVQPMDELAVLAEADEDALLTAMHEKTRYNIRLAAKHGVRARLIEQPDYARRVFPFFWELVQETAKRQKIRTHSKEYYSRMVELLIPRGVLKLMLAEYENKIIAAHLLSVFGDTVYYLHGGSSYDNRQLMAPYLLHWEGIKLAKRLEKKFYNFGGISPPSPVLIDVSMSSKKDGYTVKSWLSSVGFGGQVRHKEHPWQNLTKFKEGFVKYGETGQRLHYVGGLDFVFQPIWYRIYKAARHLQRFTRIG